MAVNDGVTFVGLTNIYIVNEVELNSTFPYINKNWFRHYSVFPRNKMECFVMPNCFVRQDLQVLYLPIPTKVNNTQVVIQTKDNLHKEKHRHNNIITYPRDFKFPEKRHQHHITKDLRTRLCVHREKVTDIMMDVHGQVVTGEYLWSFSGLGVLLVIVVGVGWKCTPRGHEPLHALFGVGDFQRRRDQRRHRTHRSRDNNWYGGVLYPEFQYRRPPPTYAASMQDYQQQLYLAQQQEQYLQNNPSNNESYSLPSSPPPSYRSRASTIHSGIHITFPPNQEDFPDSRPPTYRSRRGSSHPRPPIPREEFESMDAGPADVSFAGPDNSAQRTVVESTHNISNNSESRTTVPQTNIPDSTVTVNGRVIEPSVDNSSPRSQSESVAVASSASTSAGGANSVTTTAQSTSAQSNNDSLNNDNEDRVETSL
ncbi:hypothetical protein LOTGIDRAFT_170403 [Lottia gigantea]|uniref:Uncharacterized protein n=1 Tax=Lottia gigantea TaxID=225164 RepID=V3YVI9_LOTGI|nr:hypothetical protein LOTGIDRAFT_170403 [Lottia gigantea]ESO81993.1 hypothetical protein LOTGIDRAFT_170403 [Lottia gigantea]